MEDNETILKVNNNKFKSHTLKIKTSKKNKTIVMNN